MLVHIVYGLNVYVPIANITRVRLVSQTRDAFWLRNAESTLIVLLICSIMQGSTEEILDMRQERREIKKIGRPKLWAR